MPDELDATLRRLFADADQPLAAEDFTRQLAARLAANRGWRLNVQSLGAVAGTILGGLTVALGALRLKHARLMVMGAAAVTVWVSFL
jgi:hypothetical protein